MANNVPPPNHIAQFANTVGQLAQRIGLAEVVVVVRDPVTKLPHFIASGESMTTLRSAIGDKLGFADPPDTGWDQ